MDIVTDRSGRATFTYRTEEAISVGPVEATVVIPNDQVNGALVTSEFSKAIIVLDAQTVTGVTAQPVATGVGTETNSTLDGTTFELVRKDTAVGVPPAMRYDPHRKRAVLNPSEPLRTGATHVARLGVTTSGQGPGGQALASNKAWSFTAGA